jgi:hypothetical protein
MPNPNGLALALVIMPELHQLVAPAGHEELARCRDVQRVDLLLICVVQVFGLGLGRVPPNHTHKRTTQTRARDYAGVIACGIVAVQIRPRV